MEWFMQLSCSLLYNPLLWPQQCGESSYGGGLMGLHPSLSSAVLPRTYVISAACCWTKPELLVAAQGCDGANFGSWSPTFFFLLKFKRQIFQRLQSKVLRTVCFGLTGLVKPAEREWGGALKRLSYTKCPLPHRCFAIMILHNGFVLQRKWKGAKPVFLGMVILAYLVWLYKLKVHYFGWRILFICGFAERTQDNVKTGEKLVWIVTKSSEELKFFSN